MDHLTGLLEPSSLLEYSEQIQSCCFSMATVTVMISVNQKRLGNTLVYKTGDCKVHSEFLNIGLKEQQMGCIVFYDIK